MNDLLLKTTDLTKQYGKQKAVNRVNMHVRQGAIYGFIGRNGAGKTTFLKMVSGLSSPTKGQIELFGHTGAQLARIRSRVGCLIEEPGLYKNMTAAENLMVKCQLCGIRKKDYVDQILETVGLSHTGNKKTKHFSLGMKQRLGIGLALVGEPDLLLLDEPINGLDPQGIVEVRDMILRLNREKNITIIISSHILEELSKLVTNYGIIHNGCLIQELTQEELMEKCCERIEIVCDEPKLALPILDSMGIRQYKTLDKDRIRIYERLTESAIINQKLVSAGISVHEIFVTNEDLETYFLNLTGGAQQ